MAKEIEKKIAKDLLSIKAVFFRPEEPVYLGQRDQEPGLLRQQADPYSTRSETGH